MGNQCYIYIKHIYCVEALKIPPPHNHHHNLPGVGGVAVTFGVVVVTVYGNKHLND